MQLGPVRDSVGNLAWIHQNGQNHWVQKVPHTYTAHHITRSTADSKPQKRTKSGPSTLHVATANLSVSVCLLEGHHGVHFVNGRGEGAQPDFLWVGNKVRPGLSPAGGHLCILVSVDQHVKWTCTAQSHSKENSLHQIYLLQQRNQ